MTKLLIVESPTKAKTISKFLGHDYHVLSSYGHVRDLPKSNLGVDIEHGYAPTYEVSADSKKHVAVLKKAAKEADEVLFATDEDREGEAISWHLAEILGIEPREVKRVVFHEITKRAIEAALQHPRPLEMPLVDAQQARRVLDRLYGYEISPLLWRKIAPKLSAGRVQSVATRIIVERERERMRFVRANYWDAKGTFCKADTCFPARLVEVAQAPLASGKHFDPASGHLTKEANMKGVRILDEKAVLSYLDKWAGSAWTVASVEEKPATSHPSAPFTTSTLQQEAARKLRLSSKETMRTAQALYERGFITYMRTDSTTLSDQAIAAARDVVRERFGEENLPSSPRQFQTKVKNAQEAHEAIRPSGESFRSPEEVKGEVDDREAALYDLIWKRTVASQMISASLRHTTARLSNGEGIFAATGKIIDVAGYLSVYLEGADEAEEEAEATLPALAAGDMLDAKDLVAEGHETKPPARYTEATLIKMLEANGIGRPSTFASIISTIMTRDYVRKVGQALVPTFKAFAVVQLLEQWFTHLVDTGFTAEMEEGLDAISRGEKETVPFLDTFYHGGSYPGLASMLQSDIDPKEACTIPLSEHQGSPVNIRVGRFSPYLEWRDLRVSLPEDMTPEEVTAEAAEKLLAQKAEGPKKLGLDPDSGLPIYALSGRFGPYVQLGEKSEDSKPKMKSLPRGMKETDVTLPEAQFLLSLPNELGVNPANSEPVVLDLGRFGPYIKCGAESRSLKAEDSIFTMTLARALELLAQEKTGRSGRRITKKTVLKDLGDGLQILDGRYGPYVTDGKKNASLPKESDASAFTREEAEILLEKKKATRKKKS